ncbi:MAG: glycosyltransferase [Thermoplasmatales archaeon]
MSADKTRVQNQDDESALKEMKFRGKVWNPPKCLIQCPIHRIQKGVLYFLGRIVLHQKKGTEEIVKIATICPDMQFKDCGSGKLKSVYEYASAKLDNFKYKGFVSDLTLFSLMSRASVCVSMLWGENFGMAVVEAMAHGLPTIVYTVMAMRENATCVIHDAEQASVLLRELKEIYSQSPEAWLQRKHEIQRNTFARFSDEAVILKIREMPIT